MKKFMLALVVGMTSVNAFAGSVQGINWGCSETQGYEVTGVTIQNGVATVSSFSKIAQHMPIIIGGPFKNLETFGGGDFVGVKSLDGNFSFIAGTLTFKSNFGGMTTFHNLSCKNL